MRYFLIIVRKINSFSSNAAGSLTPIGSSLSASLREKEGGRSESYFFGQSKFLKVFFFWPVEIFESYFFWPVEIFSSDQNTLKRSAEGQNF
jgi:hypothetical protein